MAVTYRYRNSVSRDVPQSLIIKSTNELQQQYHVPRENHVPYERSEAQTRKQPCEPPLKSGYPGVYRNKEGKGDQEHQNLDDSDWQWRGKTPAEDDNRLYEHPLTTAPGGSAEFDYNQRKAQRSCTLRTQEGIRKKGSRGQEGIRVTFVQLLERMGTLRARCTILKGIPQDMWKLPWNHWIGRLTST